LEIVTSGSFPTGMKKEKCYYIILTLFFFVFKKYFFIFVAGIESWVIYGVQ